MLGSCQGGVGGRERYGADYGWGAGVGDVAGDMVFGVSGWDTFEEGGGYGSRGEEVSGVDGESVLVGIEWAEDVWWFFVGRRANRLFRGDMSEPTSSILRLSSHEDEASHTDCVGLELGKCAEGMFAMNIFMNIGSLMRLKCYEV